MEYSIPMRSRDPRSRYDDDPYPPQPYARGDSPPRRQKSHRHRRAPSLDAISPDDHYEPRRSRRHHESPPAPDRSRRYHSPEPRPREPRSSRHGPDPYARDPYEREPPRRGHRRSPSPEMRRARTMPHADAGYKSRGRGYPSPPPPYGGRDDYERERQRERERDRDPSRRRRPVSQARGYDRDPSPRRGRPPVSSGNPGRPAGRRSSMPATTKGAKNPWWQNPMVQAGARTAFAAGAQAVMSNRDDPSPWLGAKGAKVATAVLGAALVDGFVGTKHPGGTRHNLMKQGVDMAAMYAAQGVDHHARKEHSGGRSRRRH